jgi:Secretion system C-terminal sorting domain/Galactose oxidase, central domain
MKTILCIVAFLLFATFSSAQISPQTPWTWMKGDNTINQAGNYGLINVASSSNKPGSRNYSTTWTDANGNLWLFGGSGYGTSNVGYLNDLWKFDPLIKQWIWMKGDNTINQYSVYGTQGIANTANKPGAIFGAVSWTDVNGNLWLFGGFGYTHNAFGYLNSLWKYNINTGQWTWVKGDNTIETPGFYGTIGVESDMNKPGARYGSQTWTDANGNLWMFGGFGYSGSASGILNDIWKYNPSTNRWTWIKGDNTANQVGVFGTKGISNAANKPGARYVCSSWTDLSGNFWIFGGYGYDEQYSGNLNDTWKYNPVTNQWTWVHGDKLIDRKAVFGTRGVSSPSNKPGSRYVSNSWRDTNGDLLMIAGYGFDQINSGYLNDLWKYNITSNTWTWLKGDSTIDQRGVYGTQGTPAPSNKSGSRTGSVTWADPSGNFWMFGGYGYDYNNTGILNDLWKINSNSALPLNLLSFNGVLNSNTVYLNWQTEEETDFSHFTIERSSEGIHFTAIGNVNSSGISTRNSYRFDDYNIHGLSSDKIFYRLKMTDKDGKYKYSRVILFHLDQTTGSLGLFPNPSTHSISLSFENNKKGNVQVNVTDSRGAIIQSLTENIAAGKTSLIMDISTLSSGTYFISVIHEDGILQQKFVKQ